MYAAMLVANVILLMALAIVSAAGLALIVLSDQIFTPWCLVTVT